MKRTRNATSPMPAPPINLFTVRMVFLLEEPSKENIVPMSVKMMLKSTIVLWNATLLRLMGDTTLQFYFFFTFLLVAFSW